MQPQIATLRSREKGMDKKYFQLIFENVKVAFGSIRSQWLRAILTMLIIAIGITALVGILTSIDGIKSSITSNFTSMGANTFTIRNRGSNIRIGRGGKRPKNYTRITFREAERFQETFEFPALVSVSAYASFASTLKHGSEKTQPNINVMGCDANYFNLEGIFQKPSSGLEYLLL